MQPKAQTLTTGAVRLRGHVLPCRRPSGASSSLRQPHCLAGIGSQEESDISVLEAALRDQLSRDGGDTVRSVLETERITLAAARVGQHVFAVQVLANCGGQCVFCGLRPATFGARRMLLAGHIKPWKDKLPKPPTPSTLQST